MAERRKLVSANKIPKPKPAAVRLPAIKRRKSIVGRACTYTNHHYVGKFQIRELL